MVLFLRGRVDKLCIQFLENEQLIKKRKKLNS